MAGSKRTIERLAWEKLAHYMGPYFYGTAGDVFWVDSGVTTSGNGTFKSPYSTIDAAINACTASHGDVVAVKSRHAETISAATIAVMDTIDVAVVGMGEGDNRPLLSYSLAGGNIPISAAGCSLKNVRLTVSAAVDVTAMIAVTAAGVTLKDIEVLNPAATYETVQVVTASTAATRLVIDNVTVRGSTGSAMTQCFDLTAVTDATIKNCHFSGSADNWIEFSTACTNVIIENCTFRDAVAPTLGFTHDILDTAGTSTYRVINCYDAYAGAKIDGTETTGIGLSVPEQTLSRSNIMDDTAANLKGWTYCGSIEITNLFGVVTTVMTADATASKFQFNPDAAGAVDLCAAPTDGFASDAVGTAYYLVGDAAATVLTEVEANAAAYDIGEPGTIRSTVIVQSQATGTIAHTAGHASQTGVCRWSLRYKPVDRGSFAYKTP
ncbi:MAG TPA: hypothetical protein VMY42_27135 [Thermoguttaceae bacterium]|nr:hypothetical protein [Thermoguttaceae bacterium]